MEKLLLLAPTQYIATVKERLIVKFEPVKMKTPAGEIAQTGDVHPVGSAGSLVRYVALRSPQYVLLGLSMALT